MHMFFHVQWNPSIRTPLKSRHLSKQDTFFLATAVLSQVKIDLKDTVVQVVYRSLDYTQQYFIRIRVQK